MATVLKPIPRDAVAKNRRGNSVEAVDLVTGLERKLFPSIEGLRNTQRLLKPRNPKLEFIKVEELIDDRIVRKLEESGFIARLQATYSAQ